MNARHPLGLPSPHHLAPLLEIKTELAIEVIKGEQSRCSQGKSTKRHRSMGNGAPRPGTEWLVRDGRYLIKGIQAATAP